MDYPKTTLKSQAGQGLIEYILLLTVVVLMILGALYQFNQAFAYFANNYFGSYLSCLIESGELPNLNGTGGTDGNICNQYYQPFSLANGKPLVSGSTGSGAGSGTNLAGSGGGATAGGSGGSGNGNLTAILGGGSSRSSFGASSSRFAAPNLRAKGAGAGGGGGALGGDAITDLASYSQDRTIRIPLRRRDGILGNRYRQEEEKEPEKNQGDRHFGSQCQSITQSTHQGSKKSGNGRQTARN